MKPVRVRFAPSPTGPLHIGGLRTALFNYLFARKHRGTFILRIEDTDRLRYVDGAEKYIIDALNWCGLTPDEGIVQGGPFAPYRQSDRNEIYRGYAMQLVESGNAYFAFDKPEDLDTYRSDCEKQGKTFAYNALTRMGFCNSLSLTSEQYNAKIDSGEAFVIRFKTPESGSVKVNDIIRGEVEFPFKDLDDKVLFKSDGTPTYHLANIVDDHLMQISHVIRGEEWLPSLPLHVLLYAAFGWDAPQFAHLPLILKPSGKGKLSKRDGDQLGFPVFPLQWTATDGEVYNGYREAGYFSEALNNILVLLGWNPGDEQEILSLNEMIEKFDLEKVGKSGSRFDPDKSKWFNHQYLIRKTDNEIATLFEPILKSHGIDANRQLVLRVCGMVKERLSFVHEMWDETAFFFVPPQSYDEAFVKKQWKPETATYLNDITKLFGELQAFTATACENAVKQYIEQNEMGFGKIANPLRLALVGAGKGPHLFDIVEVLGRDETIRRIERAVEVLQ
ncbi:MAG TPA: glutamate--tRNA ligase [Bacteroidales bacterium]|nr:glutamate--tRNA ligase [Bacteroidales bacterium]